MIKPLIKSWMDVQAEVLHRLHAGVWKPGELLPGEADLAAEFGCARTTVNRALQSIAEEGLLERRRRGGTRVVVHPERKAVISIPVIRHQVEQQGQVYGYRMLSRRMARPSRLIRDRMQVDDNPRLLNIRAIHTADKNPYIFENRWIDVAVVPAAQSVDFRRKSPNEWLVETVPFHGGKLMLGASNASAQEAEALECRSQAAVFNAERTTRNAQGNTITHVRLVYAPGYQMVVDL